MCFHRIPFLEWKIYGSSSNISANTLNVGEKIFYVYFYDDYAPNKMHFWRISGKHGEEEEEKHKKFAAGRKSEKLAFVSCY
jgi:hypothetical protein